MFWVPERVPHPVVDVQRLQTRPQFQAAMAGGTVSRTAHFALHRLVPGADVIAGPGSESSDRPLAPQALFGVSGICTVWMGALVPKRWARRAVTRNTIKRQIYVVSADFEARLPQAAHVVRLRAEFSRKLFVSATSDALKHAVRAELTQLFSRAVVTEVAPLPTIAPATPAVAHTGSTA